MSSLPEEIYRATKEGKMSKVVKWLRKGGHVDALFPLEQDGTVSIASSIHQRGCTISAVGQIDAGASLEQLLGDLQLGSTGSSVKHPYVRADAVVLIRDERVDMPALAQPLDHLRQLAP